jgi:hypothetical protein
MIFEKISETNMSNHISTIEVKFVTFEQQKLHIAAETYGQEVSLLKG